MDFDRWAGAAWDRHADDPEHAAADLETGAALATSPAQLARLMHLAHHLLGEHLGRWDAGVTLLQGWRAHPQFGAGAEAGDALRLYVASLALCASPAGPAHPNLRAETLAALSPTDAVRAQALAACNLALHDSARALAWFESALADAAAVPDAGPHLRTLAVCGNTLACTLEERPQRNAAERALMIRAAQTARRCWALAGGWLETERAEYRLAQTWLKAGEPHTARGHALQCLEIVGAHGGVALERFFGFEALALAESAAGDAAAATAALQRAREAFAELDAADRAWCQASLDRLAASL